MANITNVVKLIATNKVATGCIAGAAVLAFRLTAPSSESSDSAPLVLSQVCPSHQLIYSSIHPSSLPHLLTYSLCGIEDLIYIAYVDLAW